MLRKEIRVNLVFVRKVRYGLECQVVKKIANNQINFDKYLKLIPGYYKQFPPYRKKFPEVF